MYDPNSTAALLRSQHHPSRATATATVATHGTTNPTKSTHPPSTRDTTVSIDADAITLHATAATVSFSSITTFALIVDVDYSTTHCTSLPFASLSTGSVASTKAASTHTTRCVATSTSP